MTTLPTIHLNGTSKRELLDSYLRALDALQDAVDALGKVEFNARDYCVQGSGAWSKATDERLVQFNKLYDVKDNLTEIAEHISNA